MSKTIIPALEDGAVLEDISVGARGLSVGVGHASPCPHDGSGLSDRFIQMMEPR